MAPVLQLRERLFPLLFTNALIMKPQIFPESSVIIRQGLQHDDCQSVRVSQHSTFCAVVVVNCQVITSMNKQCFQERLFNEEKHLGINFNRK